MQNQTLTDAEMLRYSRQILLDGWDIDAQINLKNSHVLIIGMGGLGCPLAETLTRAGVGHLSIVDDDVIDESNLQRQSLFTPDDVGQSKVLTAQKKLNKINEFVKIQAFYQRFDNDFFSEDNILKNSLSNLRLICDCTDNFKTRDLINKKANKKNIALLSTSAIAENGQLTLFEPNTGCYHCLFQGEGDDNRRCINTGVLASTTQIMGNLQAQVALHYLGLKENIVKNQLLLWNGKDCSLRKITFKKDQNCAVCGELC